MSDSINNDEGGKNLMGEVILKSGDVVGRVAARLAVALQSFVVSVELADPGVYSDSIADAEDALAAYDRWKKGPSDE